MRAFISSIGAFKPPVYPDETAYIESGNEYSDSEPEIIVDRTGQSDSGPRWTFGIRMNGTTQTSNSPREAQSDVDDRPHSLPNGRGRVGVATALSFDHRDKVSHADADETSRIIRRETGSEKAEALDEICSMLSGLHDGGEHQLPSEPGRLPQNLDLGRQGRPSQRSWAAIASRGNVGRENIDLTTPARSSRWGSLAGGEGFQVKVPEGW